MMSVGPPPCPLTVCPPCPPLTVCAPTAVHLFNEIVGTIHATITHSLPEGSNAAMVATVLVSAAALTIPIFLALFGMF